MVGMAKAQINIPMIKVLNIKVFRYPKLFKILITNDFPNMAVSAIGATIQPDVRADCL